MKIILSSLLVFLFINCSNTSNQKQTEFTYIEHAKWPSLPDGYELGSPSAIGIDSRQNIFVFQRALNDAVLSEDGLIRENSILRLDHESGNILASWGSNQFKKPHGLTVDQDDNIWVTDVTLQQIFKFSHDGQLLMALGEKNVAGNDATHFDQPTDVVVSPDGSFYVADGYGNSRIVKFSAKGEYLLEWGKFGILESEFNIPHALDVDNLGNIYVADRQNNRIQVFDSNGKFLKMWADSLFAHVQSVTVDRKNTIIYAVDYRLAEDNSPIGSDIIIINPESGKIDKQKFSEDKNRPISRYHDLVVDTGGNIFTADIIMNKLHRFSKKRAWCIDRVQHEHYSPIEKDFYTTDYFTNAVMDWLDEYWSQ